MSKIGVGVGEDFPVDDGKQPEPGERHRSGERGGETDAEHAARHEAHRRWHEQRREWKQQWKEQWRAKRDAFREEAHSGAYAGHGYYDYGHRRGPRMSWQGIFALLALCGVIALVGFAFTHIYALLGIIIVTALIFAYRRGFDPFDFDFFHDHRRPTAPAPKAPEAPQTKTNQENT
jgi:Flp pilus assembly protein TadB